ncbi:MAG: WD40/YVTN/BNR-like repeat-containing protein [Candidatus Sulfotelmatobacter sp.]
MRLLLTLILAATSAAQSGPRADVSRTTESLRGVSAVSREVAWASGTHGTYLRTVDAGRTWTPAQVLDAATLDFRAVVVFSANEAFLMSAGPGEQSRIYHTADGGKHWQLQFTNTNPKGFFDSMAFWDPKHGVVLGDPIPDEHGKLKFELLMTDDGQTWRQIPSALLPEAEQGEGAFAASNSCIAILRGESRIGGASRPAKRKDDPSSFAQSISASAPRQPINEEGASAPADTNIWFATGGKVARVFHSPDRGQTWQVFNTPIIHGPESAGIFSIAFRDSLHGVIAGGDYKHPKDDGPNLAFTSDGGKTWILSPLKPQAYFSAVTYDARVNQQAMEQQRAQQIAGQGKKKIRVRPEMPQRLFIIGPDFVFDFRPPGNPRRLSGKSKQGFGFNAVASIPEGGALIVGPKGSITFLP